MQATVAMSESEASTAIQQAAAHQGWVLSPPNCGGGWLVFDKSVSAFSWGSQLRVHLQAVSPTETQLTVSTGETFALTDWGRGKRAAKRLFDAIGAS